MSDRVDKFIRDPIDKEDGQCIVYDSTSELWVSEDGIEHTLDYHSDVPTKPETGNRILESQNGNLAWVNSIGFGGPSMMTFSAHNGNYNYHESKSDHWGIVLTFPFPGTSIFNPTDFSIICSKNCSTGNGLCRLYDLTNNNVVAYIEWEGQDMSIYSDSQLQNLPSNQAIFEVQLRRSNCPGYGSIRFYSCILR